MDPLFNPDNPIEPIPGAPGQGKEEEKPEPESDTGQIDVSPGSSDSSDVMHMKEVKQELRRQEVEELVPTDSSDEPEPPADIASQINTVNSVMKNGILTQNRAKELGIRPIQSADRNPNTTEICLNYIQSEGGKKVSLTHTAKGGIPVVLERQKDSLENETPTEELSERAHHSMLFVVTCKVATNKMDAHLELINSEGNKVVSTIYLSKNQYGCAETRARGSIQPDNIEYVILPERLKQYQDKIEVPPEKLKFVDSVKEEINYNIGTKPVGKEITIPDYEKALVEIQGEIFTHMMRCPTKLELSDTSKTNENENP